MAVTHKISTSIVIEAPPSLVRQTLLDFPSYLQWASTHIRNVKVIDTSKAVSPPPAGHALDGPVVGSKLEVQLAGMSFKPNVVANTTSEFAWLGQFVIPKLLLDGRHAFTFNAIPASGNVQRTEFVQSEEFQGALCTLLKYTSFGTDTVKGFEAFNVELKKRCEELNGR